MSPAPDQARLDAIRGGALPRLFVSLSVPALLVTALHGVNVLIDVVYAGRLIGTSAVAALGVVHTLNHVVFSLEALIATGAAAAMSVAVGRGDRAAAREIFAATAIFCVAASALLLVLGLLFARDALAFLGLQGATLEMAWQYFRVYLGGSLLIIYAFCTGTLLQARGRLTAMTMYQAVGIGVTALVTPASILSGMGLAGAAMGIVAGAAVTGVLNTVALVRERDGVGGLRTSRTAAAAVLKVGQSGMLIQLVYFLQGVLVYRALSRIGTESDLALMGATFRFVLLAVYIATGFSRAFQPVAGINFGAGDRPRVLRAFVVFNAGALAIVAVPWVIVMAYPAAILHLVAPGLTLSAGAVSNFRSYMLVGPVVPFLLMSMTLYQAIGLQWHVTVFGLVRVFVLFLPAMLLAPAWFGIAGVYYALAWMDLSLAVIAVVTTIVVVRPRLSHAAAVPLPSTACS
jgi:Na+-driven multidrug efflux pump